MKKLALCLLAAALCLWATAAVAVPTSVLEEGAMITGFQQLNMNVASDSTTFSLTYADEDTSDVYDASGLWAFQGGIAAKSEAIYVRICVTYTTTGEACADSAAVDIDGSADNSNWIWISHDALGRVCGAPAGEKGYRQAYSHLKTLPYPTKYIRVRVRQTAYGSWANGCKAYISYRGILTRVG